MTKELLQEKLDNINSLLNLAKLKSYKDVQEIKVAYFYDVLNVAKNALELLEKKSE